MMFPSPSILDKDAFKYSVLQIINNGFNTDNQLIHHASTALHTMESVTMPLVAQHTIDVHQLLQAMLEGAYFTGSQRYTAAVIIVAHQQGKASLERLAHDWFYFFLWPSM
jgi:hypothetical protein